MMMEDIGMNNILLLEDDKSLNRGISFKLKKEGYNVFSAFGIEEAKNIFAKEEICLIISDIGLPDGSGFDFCEEIRKKSDVYIIMLTALDEEVDIVTGYDLGADDYITKPFNPLELVARVNAQIRRVYKLSAKQNASPKIVIGDIELDTYNVKLIVRGKEVEVTSIEYGILKYLMENAGRILTKNQIFEAVWNEAFLSGDNTIMVHISRLRDKIEEDSRNPVYLKTVRGLGYKFEKR